MTKKPAPPKDALETLGTLIDANQQRDAIHLAVYPCQAGEHLERGERVWLNADGKAIGEVHQPENGPEIVGIVDPFLSRIIYAGEWFWLVLNPRSVTSLRHHWEHPAFKEVPGFEPSEHEIRAQAYREHQVKLLIGEPEAVARQTIRDAAADVGVTEEQMLKLAHDWVNHGDTHHTGDREPELPADFWEAYTELTGKPVPQDKQCDFFRCAC